MNKTEILEIKNQRILEIKLQQVREIHSSDVLVLEKEIINTLVTALLIHGKDTNQMRQIAQISKVLGQSLGLSLEYCNRLEQAARIYDVGNIAIASEVYKKEDKLSFEEFEIVKHHTLKGYNILIDQGFSTTDLGAIISAEHHEWWDGSGYPRQQKGLALNIASRIVAVSDTVGALFRKRPGRESWSYAQILQYIEDRSSIQFDPNVVDVFRINKEAIHEILCTDLNTAPSAWYS